MRTETVYKFRFYLFICLFCMLLSGIIVSAQNKGMIQQGYPYIRNYKPTDYNAHAQNFDMVQDERGIMYFANFAGVLQFDGTYWKLITTRNISRVSSLALGHDGSVYVGANGEIGVLETANNGILQFRSFNPLIEEQYLDFTYVNYTLALEEDIYFFSKNCIFIYSHDELISLPVQDEILYAARVNNQLILQLQQQGLVSFQDQAFAPVSAGEHFISGFKIIEMIPYGEQFVFATSTHGLFILEENRLVPFGKGKNNILENCYINTALLLDDGDLAIGTSSKGVIILSPSGEIRQTINQGSGLRNQYIQKLFIDHTHNLWAALNNGISLIKFPAQLTYFDEKSGLEGGVRSILRHAEQLYAGTYQGLYWFNKPLNSFQPIPEIAVACWHLAPYKDDVLAATSKGVFRIRGTQAQQLSGDFSYFLLPSSFKPNSFYCGKTDGLYISTFDSQGENSCMKVEGSYGNVISMIEDKKNNIWYKTLSSGIFKYNPHNKSLVHFNKSKGIPTELGNELNVVNNQLLITTQQGIYRYQEQTDSFTPFSLFGNDTSRNKEWFHLIVEDTQGNLWVTQGNDKQTILYKVEEGGGYTPYQTPFLPIAEQVIQSIYFDIGDIVYLGGPDGLIEYNPHIEELYHFETNAHISEVVMNYDSLIYGGEWMFDLNNDNDEYGQEWILSHRNNTLNFEYSLPVYHALGENTFQFYLEGFENDWSDWTTDTDKEYTNISAGDYIFHVRGKNIYGQISGEDSFVFTILTPWYLTFWAIILDIIILSVLVYLIVRWRSRRLIREKNILESKIEERTAEVVKQKDEIEKQSVELSAKNEELEKINIVVKSINSEIQISRLMQSLLEKTRMIKTAERSTVLVWDKQTKNYKFKASVGWNIKDIGKLSLTQPQAKARYLKGAEEVYEDIYLKSGFTPVKDLDELNKLKSPRSILVLVIKVENKIDGFLILENMSRENAFGDQELSFVRNLKEHIVSAFIKSKILEDLQETLSNLKETQMQLVQSEKLASLGQLTAGIAHEIQNPLNFVNNFAVLSEEMVEELKGITESIKDTLDEDTYEDILDIANTVESNVKKINEHGQRAESIVKGMLQHSRGKSGEFAETDINKLVQEYVNLAYHGMRAKDKSFNVKFNPDYNPNTGSAFVVPQDFSRAILNIVNNACYAVHEKSKKLQEGYHPEIDVTTKRQDGNIIIRIKDNGTGIPDNIIDRIFNPFFTTKPTGKGTGLGLSMTNDIITQIHKGKLEVQSESGKYTEFTIIIPVNAQSKE